jgi:hypothetical protein
MTAKDKIVRLTRIWYGYTIVSGAATLVARIARGLNAETIVVLGAGMLSGLFVVSVLGRSLLGKSSSTRSVLVVIAVIAMAAGSLMAVSAAWSLLHDGSLASFVRAAYAVAIVAVNATSYRVLQDSSVRAYF